MRISVFAPRTQDIKSFFSQDPMTLKSETYQKFPTFEVMASGVHLKRVSAPMHMRKASGTTIDLLHIAELTLDSTISTDQAPTGSKIDETMTSLLFHLSDLKYAAPKTFVTPDYLGNRKVNIEKTYVVKCSNNGGCSSEFRLEKHYSRWREHGPNKEVVCSQRVLSWHDNGSAKVAEIPNLLKLADDVALLLTFAARHRVMVLGYHYSTQQRSFQQFRSPLERNRIARPETGRDELIPLREFEAFMDCAVTAWKRLSAKDRDRIRLAIVALHPLTQSSPERDYLAMFAALEGLIGFFDGKGVSEIEKNWKGVIDALSICIDNQQSLSPEAKCYLKERLPGLKQESLSDQMVRFFGSLNVAVNDLWPVFGKDKLPGLYWARNWLAHGRHFSDERFSAFLRAQEHLSLVLERVVLCVLGFGPHRTTAGIQTLNKQGRRLSNAQLMELQTQLSGAPAA